MPLRANNEEHPVGLEESGSLQIQAGEHYGGTEISFVPLDLQSKGIEAGVYNPLIIISGHRP